MLVITPFVVFQRFAHKKTKSFEPDAAPYPATRTLVG